MASPEQRGGQPQPEEGQISRRQFLEGLSDKVFGGVWVVGGGAFIYGAYAGGKMPLYERLPMGVVGATAISYGIFHWIEQPLEALRGPDHRELPAQDEVTPTDDKIPPQE